MRESLNDITDYIENQLSLLKFGKITIELTVKNREIVHIERSVKETLQLNKKAS